MKKIIFILSLFTMHSAYALPDQLTEAVYLKSYLCGADSCYLDMEPTNVVGVSFSVFCGDGQYCRQYHTAYEKLAERANDDEQVEYPINQNAQVRLKLVDNPFAGVKMYEVTSIKYTQN